MIRKNAFLPRCKPAITPAVAFDTGLLANLGVLAAVVQAGLNDSRFGPPRGQPRRAAVAKMLGRPIRNALLFDLLQNARYRVRTCDPYRVKVVLYH